MLLTGFPSRRILNRHATGNAAALTVNDSRHGTAQLGLIVGIELCEFFFADVFNILFHISGSAGLLEAAALTQRRPLVSQAGSCFKTGRANLGAFGVELALHRADAQPTFAFKA